ncbi:VOC family protein [Phycisphaerales bacterium AB-hyl4]|uniref:VOC family protein n=1 Tax=Natronomicrosphaera hydrolytica TaxID=3242702 RepID=A0ABV4U654_9BACT
MASITGFHHVAIRVRDFDRSVAFYTEVLGFKPKIAWQDAPKRAIMLDTGDGNYLEIFERPEQAPPPADEGAILHFALRTDDTDAVLEKARAAGCQVTMEPKAVDIPNKLPGVETPVPVRIAFVKGPEGEIVEFFQNELT